MAKLRQCRRDTGSELGVIVRSLREFMNITQEEFARRVHCTQSMVGRIESGDLSPSFLMLLRITAAAQGDAREWLIEHCREFVQAQDLVGVMREVGN